MGDDTTEDGEEDLKLVSLDDFRVRRRDGDSRPEPVEERIPGTDKKIEVIPPNNGLLEAWGEDLDTEDPDPETIVDMINSCFPEIVHGDMDEVTVEELTGGEGAEFEFVGYAPTVIRQIVKNAAGYEAFLGTQQQENRRIARAMREMSEDLDVDPEDLGVGEDETSGPTKPPASESTS